MNLTAIYSNLSLQILKIKDVEFFYDEYFNFATNNNSGLQLCVVMQSIKPIYDEEIFLNFISKLKRKNKKIIIITDDIYNLEKIISDLKSHVILLEFPLSKIHKNNISIKNLFDFQFPFSKEISSVLKLFLNNTVNAFCKPKVKNICLDFDNTLWGGIIGNENILNNQFEKSDFSFLFFQNKLKELKKYGILLCLVTKNNISDIELFFKKNPSMPLSIDDFIIIKANGDKKSKNISEISKELDISVDTFLYFDDSDFELEEVQIKFPQLRCFKVSSESLCDLMFLIPEFQEIISRKNIVDKTLLYKKEFVRKKILNESYEIEDPYNIDTFNRLEVKLEFNKVSLSKV